jgi:hypothetical protein
MSIACERGRAHVSARIGPSVWLHIDRFSLVGARAGMPVPLTSRLADVEIEACDRFGDHIFLNLNQVGVGVGHAERGQNVATAGNDD